MNLSPGTERALMQLDRLLIQGSKPLVKAIENLTKELERYNEPVYNEPVVEKTVDSLCLRSKPEMQNIAPTFPEDLPISLRETLLGGNRNSITADYSKLELHIISHALEGLRNDFDSSWPKLIETLKDMHSTDHKMVDRLGQLQQFLEIANDVLEDRR